MKTRYWLIKLSFLIGTLSCFLMSLGCKDNQIEDRAVKVAAAGDLYYLSMVINEKAKTNEQIPVLDMVITDNSIIQLKKGKVDAVILGRQPKPEELIGLDDIVIAYDAVCVVVDENSYLGGTIYSGKMPVRKSAGLRNLPAMSLADIFAEKGWNWGENYYDGNRDIDPDSFLLNIESVAWLPGTSRLVSSFVFPKGKFDTQTVLFQSLGLDEAEYVSNRKDYTTPLLNIEEEVLSLSYLGSNYSQKISIQEFPFKIGFASRRAMTIAPNHSSVRAISINGVDPVEDTQAIYDGSYLFSRRIHLLVKKNSPAKIGTVLEYFLSSEGQRVLSEIGYLPLIKDG